MWIVGGWVLKKDEPEPARKKRKLSKEKASREPVIFAQEPVDPPLPSTFIANYDWIEPSYQRPKGAPAKRRRSGWCLRRWWMYRSSWRKRQGTETRPSLPRRKGKRESIDIAPRTEYQTAAAAKMRTTFCSKLERHASFWTHRSTLRFANSTRRS